MSSVLVTPTYRIPLGAVSAAAIDVAGRERVWLDTGGLVIGIRVPAELAERVEETARMYAGVLDDEDPAGEPADALTPTPPTEPLGRPACEEAAHSSPGGAPESTPSGPPWPRRKKSG